MSSNGLRLSERDFRVWLQLPPSFIYDLYLYPRLCLFCKRPHNLRSVGPVKLILFSIISFFNGSQFSWTKYGRIYVHSSLYSSLSALFLFIYFSPFRNIPYVLQSIPTVFITFGRSMDVTCTLPLTFNQFLKADKCNSKFNRVYFD